MKNKVPKILVICTLLIFCFKAFPQEYSLGGSLIYNFKINEFGFGARGEIPLKQFDVLEGIYVAPQLSFFPGFNERTEFYLGSSAHIHVYRYDKWLFYGLINLSYRGWINYDESDNEDAHFSNLAIDGGIGVTLRTCIRPFMEFRINAVGGEPNLRIGAVYTFNCDIRGAVPCSKIQPMPIIGQ